jgi:hypothetical protein
MGRAISSANMRLYEARYLLIYLAGLTVALRWTYRAYEKQWCAWIQIYGLRGGAQKRLRGLEVLFQQMQEWEDQLGGGQLPDFYSLHELESVDPQQVQTILSLLESLRSSGSPLIPVLRRLKVLAKDQWETLHFSHSRIAPARAQAWVGAGMVLLLIPAFEVLIPELRTDVFAWRLGGMALLVLAMIGAAWTLGIAEKTRWGGLSGKWQALSLHLPLEMEKLLSQIQTGQAPERAWNEFERGLLLDYPELVEVWHQESSLSGSIRNSRFQKTPEIFLKIGSQVRSAIELSIFEGRPCLERIQSVNDGLLTELRARIQKEVELIPSRTLKPLFLCLAPALLGILAWALILTWNQVGDSY